MWCYSGWEEASTIAGEVDRPQRNYPIVMLGVLVLVWLVYTVPVLALAHSGIDSATLTNGSWVDVGMKIGGRFLGSAILDRGPGELVCHLQRARSLLHASPAGAGRRWLSAGRVPTAPAEIGSAVGLDRRVRRRVGRHASCRVREADRARRHPVRTVARAAICVSGVPAVLRARLAATLPCSRRKMGRRTGRRRPGPAAPHRPVPRGFWSRALVSSRSPSAASSSSWGRCFTFSPVRQIHVAEGAALSRTPDPFLIPGERSEPHFTLFGATPSSSIVSWTPMVVWASSTARRLASELGTLPLSTMTPPSFASIWNGASTSALSQYSRA